MKQIVWVVGRKVQNNWSFLGVFKKRQKAISVCTTESDFVGPVYFDELVKMCDKATPWPKGVYPVKKMKKTEN